METPILIHESPVLQSTAKTGKAKYWKIRVQYLRGEYSYEKVWWQEGSKIQFSTPVTVVGKNIGRANETTAEEQVLSEVKSIEQKQRDKGYSEDGSTEHIPVKPMLAHKWSDKKHKVKYPCFVQPKLDGFRMLKGDNIAWTRGGKEHVRECVKHLMWDSGEFILDGELILPHMPPLQETARAAKKFRPGVSDTLVYMVYDVVLPGASFLKRNLILARLELRFPANVKRVPTWLVENEEELFMAHAQFVSEGYEGTMVRSGEGGYEIGHRSDCLLKYKYFQDAEFRIIGCEDGKGSFEGKAIFVCETEGGLRFNATPEGTMEHRAELWDNREHHISKWLTVRYQTLSEDGIPIFPIGVDIRELGEF